MAKKTKQPAHPDDLMVVGISLAFRAKPNPEVDDPPPFDMIEMEETFRAADAADYLEKVVSAIRGRRLYGFMQQECAESAVGAGDWIERTIEDVIAEATAKNVDEKSLNVPATERRHDD
jgi:hypothetical protein